MSYKEPRLLGTANQITVTEGTGTRTLAIAPPMLIGTQPNFQATCSADILDITGDGTNYALLCNTKTYDLGAGGNYSTSTGAFTAPVTGRYLFQVTMTLVGILVAHTDCLMNLVTTSTTYQGFQANPFKIANNGGVLSMSFSVITQLTAGDTAQPHLIVSGGTKVIDISSSTNTFWGGALIC